MSKRKGRPITLPEPFRRLAELCGGVDGLADELTASTRSVNRWAHRKPMSPPYRRLLAELAERHGMAQDLAPWTA